MTNKKINRFWNFSELEKKRILRIDGVIAEDSWYEDDVTPKQFKAELEAGKGDITVWINSPGGDVFSAAQIYNLLRDYDGKVTVKIDGIAASAASIVAMAGDEVQIAPVSLLMIHQPVTVAVGDTKEMQKAIAMLDEVKEAIINAYQAKTGLSRKKISTMMEEETWLNAKKAVALGFADTIMFEEKSNDLQETFFENYEKVIKNLVSWKNQTKQQPKIKETELPKNTVQNIQPLYQRLNLLKN